MFNWLRQRGTERNAERQLPDLARLSEREAVVLFKHSPSCPVSWAAHAEVKRFIRSHPGISVYTILVGKDREYSRYVAEFTGVKHESPQVIVLRRGEVVSTTSHQGVTGEFLARAVSMKPASAL
jgi:bacillithiol system protein YtxJ